MDCRLKQIDGMHKGSTWLIQGELTNSVGDPVNIAGAAIELILVVPGNKYVFPADIDDGPAGEYSVQIDPGEQTSLAESVYSYQIWATLTTGQRLVINYGPFVVLKGFKE